MRPIDDIDYLILDSLGLFVLLRLNASGEYDGGAEGDVGF